MSTHRAIIISLLSEQQSHRMIGRVPTWSFFSPTLSIMPSFHGNPFRCLWGGAIGDAVTRDYAKFGVVVSTKKLLNKQSIRRWLCLCAVIMMHMAATVKRIEQETIYMAIYITTYKQLVHHNSIEATGLCVRLRLMLLIPVSLCFVVVN